MYPIDTNTRILYFTSGQLDNAGYSDYINKGAMQADAPNDISTQPLILLIFVLN